MNKEQKITAIVTDANCKFLSSHTIAKMTESTPSYVRKVCAKLFYEGRLAYRCEYHQGRAGYKRIYVTIPYAQAVNSACRYEPIYTIPAVVQPYLPNMNIREDWQND